MEVPKEPKFPKRGLEVTGKGNRCPQGARGPQGLDGLPQGG